MKLHPECPVWSGMVAPALSYHKNPPSRLAARNALARGLSPKLCIRSRAGTEAEQVLCRAGTEANSGGMTLLQLNLFARQSETLSA